MSSTEEELGGWMKAHIKPQNVLVKKVTSFETIERNGFQFSVKPGSYIIMDNAGSLWLCSEETFQQAYADGWNLP